MLHDRSQPPMPIIVGVGRSGTTLLRFMLDAHSRLAIPPETGFLVPAADLKGQEEELRQALYRTISEAETWDDFHLSREELANTLEAITPFSVTEGLRAFYRLYARRFGKSRWGEKTPMYCLHMSAIARLLPEAHFIHVIRDGRDVALSVRGLWFAPGDSIEALAADWRDRIRTAREEGQHCRRYLEVRYEELVADPRAVLRRICDYLELPYESEMEAYYRRAPERLQEHETRYGRDGRVIVTKEQRLHNQRFTKHPPDTSRVFRWRREMSGDECERFERVAGDLLGELGYELRRRP